METYVECYDSDKFVTAVAGTFYILKTRCYAFIFAKAFIVLPTTALLVLFYYFQYTLSNACYIDSRCNCLVHNYILSLLFTLHDGHKKCY